MWFVDPPNMTANWEALAAYRLETAELKTYSLASHLFLLAALFVSLRYRYLMAASLQGLALLVSVAYHACVVWDTCGGYSAGDLQVGDHITATLLFVAGTFIFTSPQDELQDPDDARTEDVSAGSETSAHGRRAPPAAYHLRYSHVALPVQLVATALLVSSDPYSTTAIYASVMVSLWCVLAYYALFRVERRTHPGAVDYDASQLDVNVPFLLLTVVTAVLAVLCFMADAPSSFLHSTWHIWASATLAFLVFTFETRSCGRPTRDKEV